MEFYRGIFLSQVENRKSAPCVCRFCHAGQKLCETCVDQHSNLLCQHRSQRHAPAVRFIAPPWQLAWTVAGKGADLIHHPHCNGPGSPQYTRPNIPGTRPCHPQFSPE